MYALCMHTIASCLFPNPLQQRLPLAIIPIRLGVRHIPVLALLHLEHVPRAFFLGGVEELLVLFEGPAARFRAVEVRPHARDGVCRGEDEEDPVVQVVEEDRREKRDGEVGQTPDDDADGGPLRTSGGGKDFGRDQPDGGEPANAEGPCSDEQADDAWDRDAFSGQARDAVGVHRQASEQGEQEEADCESTGAEEEEGAAAEGVDEEPGEGHEDEVGDVVALGEEFGLADAVA